MPEDRHDVETAGANESNAKPVIAERQVRLSVNLNAEASDIFKRLIERKGLSISEGTRRAISIWAFFEDASARGTTIQLVEPDGRVREIILLSG